MADPFSIFGDAPAGAPQPPPVVPIVPPPAKKRTRDELDAALAPFHDHAGRPITVDSAALLPQPPSMASERQHTAALAIWPSYPPYVLGPLVLETDLRGVGGCRGFVASRDVLPGEVPMATGHPPPILTPCRAP